MTMTFFFFDKSTFSTMKSSLMEIKNHKSLKKIEMEKKIKKGRKNQKGNNKTKL